MITSLQHHTVHITILDVMRALKFSHHLPQTPVAIWRKKAKNQFGLSR